MVHKGGRRTAVLVLVMVMALVFVAGASGDQDAPRRGTSGGAGGGALDAKAITQLAEQHRRDLIDLVSKLVSAESPYGTSAAAAQDIVAAALERAGFRVDRTTDDPGALVKHPDFMPPAPWTERPVNIVARPVSVPTVPLFLFAHIDTEAARAGWTNPPLTPVLRDGRLIGLGTADDKGGVAAAVIAAIALAGAGRPAPIVASLHGKGGGARGSLPIFARLTDARAALYVHPAETGNGLREVKHSSRGVLDLALTVKGWRGRQREIGSAGSAPWSEGGDALAACLTLVAAVRKELTDAAVNLGRIAAGDGPATVPDQCRADLRVVFETGTADLRLAAIDRTLAEGTRTLARAAGAFTYELQVTGSRSSPAAVAWDSPLCSLVRRSIAEVTGTEPVSYTNHMTSDIRFPLLVAGIPGLGIGSRAGNFGGADEWVDVDDLVRFVAVLMLSTERAQESWGFKE